MSDLRVYLHTPDPDKRQSVVIATMPRVGEAVHIDDDSYVVHQIVHWVPPSEYEGHARVVLR